jgi:hypothetical protein
MPLRGTPQIGGSSAAQRSLANFVRNSSALTLLQSGFNPQQLDRLTALSKGVIYQLENTTRTEDCNGRLWKKSAKSFNSNQSR